GVLGEGYHVVGGELAGQLRPGVELVQVVLRAGLDERDQPLRAAEQVQPAGPAEEDRYLVRLRRGGVLVLFFLVGLFVFLIEGFFVEFVVLGVELVLVEFVFLIGKLILGELVRLFLDDRAVPLREGVLFPLGDVGRRHL